MRQVILVLNAGSSSLKFALYPATETPSQSLAGGKFDTSGPKLTFSAKDHDGNPLPPGELLSMHAPFALTDLIPELLDWISETFPDMQVGCVGHRVVHGGRTYSAPVRVDDTVLSDLDQLVSLAPLHEPHNIAAIRAISNWAPDLPQIACFDTSFHRTQPRLAKLFALPRHFADEGVIRYGFHGLSYNYIASVLPAHLGDRADGRVVVAHLGNGASMCAMKDRKSVASSMGFSALDGLMMGSRCGRLDAGVVLYLLRNRGMSADTIETLLYEASGLRGVSGISHDMSILEQSSDPNAREAIDLFCYRAAGELCQLASALQGLDAVVFTAGIGENSANIRRQICEQLTWLGVSLDDAANQANSPVISDAKSKVDVLVIPTDEEQVIARAVARMVCSSASGDAG